MSETMKVTVNKDSLGFPSQVIIDKNGRRLNVFTNPDQGFTIQGDRSLMPSAFEAFRVILPRVSYQKTVGERQAEDNTEVNVTGGVYELVKMLGVELTSSRTIDQVIANLKGDAGTSYLKITYEVEGGSETTWMEQTTASTDYVTFKNKLEIALDTYVIFRLYLKNPLPSKAYNKQLTLTGDTLSLVGHLF